MDCDLVDLAQGRKDPERTRLLFNRLASCGGTGGMSRYSRAPSLIIDKKRRRPCRKKNRNREPQESETDAERKRESLASDSADAEVKRASQYFLRLVIISIGRC